MTNKTPKTPKTPKIITLDDLLKELKIDDEKDTRQQNLVNKLYDIYNQVTSIAVSAELTEEQLLEYEEKEDELGDDIDKINKFFEKCGIDVEKVKAEAFSEFAEGYLADIKNVKFDVPDGEKSENIEK